MCGFVMFSCGKKDVVVPDPYPTDSLGRIDRWILDSMRRYYYWSGEITSQPDYSLSPGPFFTHLLSAKDRFSWISNGADVKAPSNSYFTYGFHYAFVQVAGIDGYLGVITAVNTNGPADRAGLQRGSYFSKVNGVSVNAANLTSINTQLKTGTRITLTGVTYNNGWQEGSNTVLSAGFAGESAVYYTRSYIANGITTGYLYYSSFDENYDAQLLAAFGKLKAAQVSELILDLRYNAGGSVASSAKLAAMVARTLTAGDTYAVYQGNSQEGRKSRTLQQVLNTAANATGRQYAALQEKALSLQRVFILTTRGTVSAAELVANNLKPFIPVTRIGETTAGKNEASFLISDYRVPRRVYWQMEPTIYKLFNKNNEGNYEAGLVPQYPVAELEQLPLGAIGSAEDPLVYKALQLIYGAGLPDHFTNLRAIKQPVIPALPVYRSAEDAVLQSLMIVKPLN
jgi:C-terminal processing protease CtpA/Prc